jgi:hypothetical protein
LAVVTVAIDVTFSRKNIFGKGLTSARSMLYYRHKVSKQAEASKMNVRIIDSIESELCTVEFKPDHLAEFARRGVIYYVPRWTPNKEMYEVLVMKHIDFIAAINEMAL